VAQRGKQRKAGEEEDSTNPLEEEEEEEEEEKKSLIEDLKRLTARADRCQMVPRPAVRCAMN